MTDLPELPERELIGRRWSRHPTPEQLRQREYEAQLLQAYEARKYAELEAHEKEKERALCEARQREWQRQRDAHLLQPLPLWGLTSALDEIGGAIGGVFFWIGIPVALFGSLWLALWLLHFLWRLT